MYFTLQIQCDGDRLWDHVKVSEHGEGPWFTYYEREVYIGQSRSIALNKAYCELEALLVAAGWLVPGELDVNDPVAGVGSRPGCPPTAR